MDHSTALGAGVELVGVLVLIPHSSLCGRMHPVDAGVAVTDQLDTDRSGRGGNAQGNLGMSE